MVVVSFLIKKKSMAQEDKIVVFKSVGGVDEE